MEALHKFFTENSYEKNYNNLEFDHDFTIKIGKSSIGYIKFTGNSRYGTFHYLLKGNDNEINEYTSKVTKEYPPPAYGTHFWKRGDVYYGNRSNNSD